MIRNGDSKLGGDEMKRIEKFKNAAKYARQLGFDDIVYSETSFKAEDTKTSVSVWAMPKSVFEKNMRIEISWASAETPRPTPAKIRRFIKMLQNALKLREKLI